MVWHAAWIESGEETDIETSESESFSDSESSSVSSISKISNQSVGLTDDGKIKSRILFNHFIFKNYLFILIV